MATRPVIMPLTPPRNVGLRALLAKMSQITQVSNATAVARLVLSTASNASAPEKYGSPPANPSPLYRGSGAPTAAKGSNRFNGGVPYFSGADASLAVLNTNLATAV